MMRSVLFASVVAAAAMAMPATAAQMVTYTWTTTSQGYGSHLGEPSSATFDVPLTAVLNGKIMQWDITNIHLTYPGLTFNSAVASATGMDFAAFVDPTTGAFIYHDVNQGLAVMAFAGTDINAATTFLSITVGNVAYKKGVPQASVADRFNALNGGNPYAGYPTAGIWTATMPVVGGVPEPSIWAMLLIGFGCTGFMLRNSRRKSVTA